MIGNKGDWSEFYVLIKLLSDGKLSRADEKLEKLSDYFYHIEKVIRSHNAVKHEYKVDSDIIKITIGDKADFSVKTDEFSEAARLIFDKILSSKGTFEIPEIYEFIKSIKCPSLKASSLEKADLHVVIHDPRTGLNPFLGFSVKSQVGANSTLMNPGKTTNFLYKISGLTLDDLAIERINNISVTRGTKKIADVKGRVSEVTKLGGELVFKKVVHPVFRANLNLIDSQLSGIAGGLLSSYFSSKGGSLAELTEQIEEDNPLGFDNSHGHKFYDYKVKRLLTDSALGMLPSKVWNGQFEANGGYIVLKQDGEILCYHLYEKDLFENYLFLNTKMDTPSATRYDYGYLFREGDEVLIKLCLQIRFKN